MEPLTSKKFARHDRQFPPGVRWWLAAPLAVDDTVRELTAIGAAGFGEASYAR
jgi:hypothetical protein